MFEKTNLKTRNGNENEKEEMSFSEDEAMNHFFSNNMQTHCSRFIFHSANNDDIFQRENLEKFPFDKEDNKIFDIFCQGKFSNILNFEDLIEDHNHLKKSREFFSGYEETNSISSQNKETEKPNSESLKQESLESPAKFQNNKRMNSSKKGKTKSFSSKENHLYRKDKNSKGLRYLSKKVKEIVFREKKSSYKSVAEMLIHSLSNQDGLRVMKNVIHLKKSNEEQNIKRRVYDALNVLIAAGILKKKGKLVYSDDSPKKESDIMTKDSFSCKNSDETFLKEIIFEKREEMREKRKLLMEYLKKKLAVTQLIKRNREIVIPETQQIKFPFLAVKLNSNITITSNPSRSLLSLKSQNELKFCGDLDFLVAIKSKELDNQLPSLLTFEQYQTISK